MKQTSSWNIPLGKVRGVPVEVHGSFLLLVIWMLASSEHGASAAIIDVLFLFGVFFCVLLHEFGHVFTGQHYGVKTRDVILYPFGGIATLMNSPTASQEFFIAVAGPIVSFCIAGALYLIADPEDLFLYELFEVNLALGVFNLIPAIPMDGGRILRSLLELCRVRAATTIAARISQACSIALGIFGFTSHNPILIFVSIFVFFGAVQELVHARTRRAVSGKRAVDLMIDREKLYCFQHGTTVTDAVRIALRSLQEIFPVLHGSSLLGLVSRQALIEAVSLSDQESYIAGLADRSFFEVTSTASLEQVLRIAEEKNTDVVAVVDDGSFLGLVFVKNIGDVMIIDTFKNRELPPGGELV